MEKKKRKPFVVHYEYDREKEAERVPGVSMTVPEESYTVRELFEKFARGVSIPGQERQGGFDSGATFDSPDLEKLKDADLVDRQEYIDLVAVEMLDKEKRIKAHQEAERVRLKEEADEMEAIRREMKERRQSVTQPVAGS